MATAQSAMRIPDSMGPAEIGPYLRELREYFKLSPQEVSERLHIRVRYVTAMEECKFSELPGKAYARGYVHTYAEFLGLDPDQVVAQCFAEDGTNLGRIPVPVGFVPMTRASPRKTDWRHLGLLIVGGLVVLLIAAQWLTRQEEKTETIPVATVAPVPEAMLASMRDQLFPIGRNYECLSNDWLLACFFANQTVVDLDTLMNGKSFPFAPDMETYTNLDTDEAGDATVTPAEETPPEGENNSHE